MTLAQGADISSWCSWGRFGVMKLVCILERLYSYRKLLVSMC